MPLVKTEGKHFGSVNYTDT